MSRERTRQILEAVAAASRDVALAKCALGVSVNSRDHSFAVEGLAVCEENYRRMLEEAIAELSPEPCIACENDKCRVKTMARAALAEKE